MKRKLVEESSKIHRAVREAHAGERAEDYCEAVVELIRKVGEARLTKIASALGVSHVSALRVFRRLQREGLVLLQPYRAIELTKDGIALAKRAAARHKVVYEFLRAIGVSHRNASLDAEGIEHHVGAESLKVFKRFVSNHVN